MDDMASKLNDLLGSPEGMQKLQQAAAALSAAMGDAASSSGVPAGEETPGQVPAQAQVPVPAASHAAAGGLGDLGSLMQLLPLLGGMDGLGGEDENTALLKALRPYLQEDRQQRLDDALKIMKLMKLLPLLSGLGGLGGKDAT